MSTRAPNDGMRRAEAMSAIVARVELGVGFEDAARASEVNPHTAKTWLAKGRKAGGDEYQRFAEAIERARATAAERRGPMDVGELAQVVSELARAGSVQAAKLRWEMLQAERGDDEQPADDDPLAELDELARRRMRGAAP